MAKRKIKAPQRVTANIKLDIRPDTPSYYVNYMAVGHTNHDFTISVARTPAFLTPEQEARAKKESIVSLETTLQLVVPPTLIKGLIEALTKQINKYEKETKQKVKNGR